METCVKHCKFDYHSLNQYQILLCFIRYSFIKCFANLYLSILLLLCQIDIFSMCITLFVFNPSEIINLLFLNSGTLIALLKLFLSFFAMLYKIQNSLATFNRIGTLID